MHKDKVTRDQVLMARRQFLKAAAAAGVATSAIPGVAFAEDAPWTLRPESDVDSVNFVVWQFGKIYENISAQFEADWGVTVDQIIEPNVEPQSAKLITMYASGEDIDVFNSPIQYIGNYIDQGIAAPLNDMPGIDQYVDDFTPIAKEIGVRDGQVWGLPYLSIAWAYIYNDELLTKAGFEGQPFTTNEELVEQCLKAKQDGVSNYPLLWVAGTGFETLPGTWFSQVCNRGGTIFDKDGNPTLGEGSIARETLRFFQETFTKHEIADPDSLNLKYLPAVKVFNTGNHLYMGTMHNYWINLVNDPEQSPIAGKGRIHGHPGDGRTFAVTWYYMMSEATRNKDWAWKMVQYLGGKTKDGEYTQAKALAKSAMLAPGYTSVLNSPEIREVWSQRVDVDRMLQIFDDSVNIEEVVPSIFEPWYPTWIDMLNVELTSCLRGEISADVACDNIAAAVTRAQG